jgi:ribonuclease BN (tRNA processing enzyme)
LACTVTVIGSADAFNSGGRGNACYLVEDNEGVFCVDFGPTALMSLKQRGVDLNDVDAVFLTHLHGDHFGGLHLLYIDAQYRSVRTRPLTICGPIGTERRVETWYRLAYGSAGRRRTYTTNYVELSPGDLALVAGRHIRTYRANHMRLRDGALHLRIRTGKISLGFTGDTAWSDELLPLSTGLDLLVCECTDERVSPDRHLSWDVLEPRLGSLRAREILLTHLSEEMRKKCGSLSGPRFSFADDGTVMKIASSKRARAEARR